MLEAADVPHFIGSPATPKPLRGALARQVITRWLPIGQKFSGGVYFHLDQEDHVLLATNDLEIQRWQLVGEGNKLEWLLVQSIAIGDILDGAVDETHRVIDVMPDWQGNYWFITRGGLVGVIDRQGKEGTAVVLGQAQRRLLWGMTTSQLRIMPMGKYMLSFMRSSRGPAHRQFVRKGFSPLTKAHPKILLRWWATV